jgi:hypothetical protein
LNKSNICGTGRKTGGGFSSAGLVLRRSGHFKAAPLKILVFSGSFF